MHKTSEGTIRSLTGLFQGCENVHRQQRNASSYSSYSCGHAGDGGVNSCWEELFNKVRGQRETNGGH